MGHRVRTCVQGILYGMAITGVGATLALGIALAKLSREATTNVERPWRARAGTLLIVGGGRTPDEVHDRFVALAGGENARIVVIPTASDHPDGPADITGWTNHRVAWVKRLHARTRAEADDLALAGLLARATGVWINGGNQDRLSEVYPDTEVERQLRALLARGGVIGGTSAGASVMSRVMMARCLHQAKLGRGLDLLPGVLIDQHFLRRNRVRRLTQALEAHPELIGLGIDEQTALMVDVGARRGRVLGKSYAVICIPDSDGSPHRLEFLKPGDEADLESIRRMGPQAIASAIEYDGM